MFRVFGMVVVRNNSVSRRLIEQSTINSRRRGSPHSNNRRHLRSSVFSQRKHIATRWARARGRGSPPCPKGCHNRNNHRPCIRTHGLLFNFRVKVCLGENIHKRPQNSCLDCNRAPTNRASGSWERSSDGCLRSSSGVGSAQGGSPREPRVILPHRIASCGFVGV